MISNESSTRSNTPVAVSFEFFPPNDAAMEATLWASIQRLAPLSPALRFGDLRRRRLDARAHAQRGRAHSARDVADPRAAPDLHRCAPRRNARRRARPTGMRACATSSRCAVTRRPGKPLRATSGRLRLRRRPRARAEDGRRLRHLRRRLSGGASRGTECAVRSRQPAREGRRRRHTRDHAVLFRHRHFPAFSRPMRGRRHRRRHRARHPADHAFSAHAAGSRSAAARPCRTGSCNASTGSRTTPRRGA